MRTVQFMPNTENIAVRSKIVPFGNAAQQYNKNLPPISFEILPFNIYTTVKIESEISTEKFVPEFSFDFHTRIQNDYSIKITNIPLRITQHQLFDILRSKNNNIPLQVYLVTDKINKNISKGVAYITCNSLEAGKEIIKSIGEVIIDDFKLNMELVKRN